MGSERLSNDDINSNRSNGANVSVNKRSGNVGLGDMIWVRLRGSSWWPAQVVDVEISKRLKPRKRSADEVLVRLYGSYQYKYVDPVTCRSEFEKILKKNDGNCRAIFESTLQKDLARLRSGSASGSKSKSEGEVQSDGEENNKIPVTTANGKSPELGSRRVKVMQNLGLIAPDGSPYCRKGPCV